MDLTTQIQKNVREKQKVTYIVKPDSLCQGKGIFLTRSIEEILEKTKHNTLLDEHNIDSDKVGYVVQQYLDQPHLIDELKYDLRLYVLLYGVNPLRIYLHKMAFARFCTEPYQKPTRKNMKNVFMHLTNYALNKMSENYEQADDYNDDEGHKRSLGAILRILRAEGCDVNEFMEQIKDMIIKTLIVGQPTLLFDYKVSQPECLDNSMAFHILGFDVIIDENFKPYLLEVNQSCSLMTDTPLDYKIKKNVVSDALGLLNFSHKRRVEYWQNEKVKTEDRIIHGKI
jgi:tubulin polyglutamylase TTLL6/13